ncbi:hypothetical protein K458DRAFT_379492, partial [Lentithecium fluviatile CBS 122367]
MNHTVDVSELPSVAHMNRPQKRALILRDQLKYLEIKHLDTFLDGISDPEPPNYKLVNGKLLPPFEEVKLREGVHRFDVGNVQFVDGQRERVSRVHFMVDNGNCELSESDALPEVDEDLNSVPIHVFIVKQMIPLFVKKYEAIEARKRTLNDLRKAARNGPRQERIRINAGKVRRSSDNSPLTSGLAPETRKRPPGELLPVPKHVSNKRQCMGLSDIPDAAKTVIFDSVPEQVKIDLFNNVIKTALPNFDNLMTAAWNVVYVHKNVGAEDRELYKAITCLEKVLLEFAAFHKKAKARSEPQEKLAREQGLPNDGRPRVPSGSAAASGPSRASNDEAQNRPQGYIPQLIRNNVENASEDAVRSPAHNRRNG